MNENETYWVAGFLEGEGCFSLHNKNRTSIKIGVNSIDLDVIEHIKVITNNNNKISTVRKSGNRKNQYRIHWYGNKALDLAKNIQNLMGERRGRKIEEITGIKYCPIKWNKKIISEKERYWLAGYLEGEGCFNKSIINDKRINKKYIHYQIQLSATDFDVVNRAANFVNLKTNINHPSSFKQHKPQLRFSTKSTDHFIEVSLTVRDLMGNRRKSKIDEILGSHVGRLLE